MIEKELYDEMESIHEEAEKWLSEKQQETAHAMATKIWNNAKLTRGQIWVIATCLLMEK